MAIQAGWAGQNYRIYSSDGAVLAEGRVGTDGKIGRTNVPVYERLVVELGDPNQTALSAIASNSASATNDCEDNAQSDKEAVDDSDWDDPAQVVPAQPLYKAGDESTGMNQAYLGERLAEQILQNMGVKQTADSGN